MEDELTLFNSADKWEERDCERRILVRTGWQAARNSDFDRDFFMDFTVQAFLRRFAWIYLSPGKLPFAGHAHGCASLCRQNKPVSLDDGARDSDMFSYG